jgi:hypothetical protein
LPLCGRTSERTIAALALPKKRLLFGIKFGAFEEGAALWNSIWADVIAQTDGREWNEIMNEGKH